MGCRDSLSAFDGDKREWRSPCFSVVIQHSSSKAVGPTSSILSPMLLSRSCGADLWAGVGHGQLVLVGFLAGARW